MVFGLDRVFIVPLNLFDGIGPSLAGDLPAGPEPASCRPHALGDRPLTFINGSGGKPADP